MIKLGSYLINPTKIKYIKVGDYNLYITFEGDDQYTLQICYDSKEQLQKDIDKL